MPIYAVMCSACGKQDEIHRSFDRYNELPQCCGQSMVRVISAPMVMGDIQPYKSMIDGTIVNSRSRHREHLKTHGCLEVGNEKLMAKKPEPPPGLKETLIRIANEKLH